MKYWSAVFLANCVLGQTSINLATQGRNWDFSNAPYTRVLKVGSSLPATCTIGDVFFFTLGAPGANFYGCTATNIWSLQGWGSSGPGGNTLSVQLSGTPVSASNTIDFIAGSGILMMISSDGVRNLVQINVDTSLVQTLSNAQSGQPVLCASTSKSPSLFTCDMMPVLTKYQFGQVLNWIPDVTCVSVATLNISTLGPVQITRADGSPLQNGNCPAKQLLQVWFDGTNFRLR